MAFGWMDPPLVCDLWSRTRKVVGLSTDLPNGRSTGSNASEASERPAFVESEQTVGRRPSGNLSFWQNGEGHDAAAFDPEPARQWGELTCERW